MERLKEFHLEQGEVVHYQGIPFYVSLCYLLGTPGNVEAATKAGEEAREAERK